MRSSVLAILSATAVAATVALAAPAPAAPSCAPDPYESADATNGVHVAVGSSVSRAICQDRTTGADVDWFSFDAAGGKAYSAGITSGGSALNVGTLDGLDVAGIYRVNSDGSLTSIEAPNAESYERFTTPVLPAGRYVFVAAMQDQVAYPDNYLGLKPAEGQAGVYTLALTEAAPAPSVTSITVPKELRPQSRPTGSYTLSGPAPAGGISLYVTTDNVYVGADRIWIPAGATKGTFTISVTNATNGAKATFSATTRVGNPATAVSTVKK